VRKFIIALVFGACLLPGAALTLGLGEIEVSSALNQKLDAKIALLSATPEDAEQLIVKLAPAAEFSRAGIDRPYLLNSLRFTTEQQNGRLFIKVSSPKPIREPFLNFLLELDWPNGRLLREYTILLDPPVYMGAEDSTSSLRPAAMQAPAAAPSPAASQGGFRPAAVAPVSDAATVSRQRASAATPSSVPAPRAPMAAGSRRVQAGDTAWSLANAMRPDASISVEQMLIAMLRTNPEVFIDNNVNGLKRGYILRVPDAQTIAAIDANQALAMVREQNALWREYQQALAGGTPASSVETPAATAPDSAMADSASGSRLNIVSAGEGEGLGGSKDPTAMSMAELRRELALASEQLETERVEKEALYERVMALQSQVEKMKSLLTIEDASMAEMQAAAESSAQTMPMTHAEGMDDSQGGEAAADAAADATVAEEADTAQAGDESLPADTEDNTAQDAEPLFVDEGQAATDTAQAVTEAQPAAPQTVVDSSPVHFDVPPKKDPIAQIMANPLLMGGIAGGLLLIVLLVLFLLKRRKSVDDSAADTTPAPAAEVEDELEQVADMVEDEPVTESPAEAALDEAETVADEDDFDAESTMVLSTEDTVVTQADALDEEEEEDRDDVIAEADVYLAYGIYQQAEELLQNAIEEHPDRDAYRVKLAETHYAGKNAEAFVEVASELKQRAGSDSKAWAKVVAMGKDLCPDHELFQASDMVDGVDLDDLAPKLPEMDFDLDSEAGGDDTPDLDFSLDDEETAAPQEDSTGDSLELPDISDSEDTAVLEAIEETKAEDELEFDLSETDAVAPGEGENEEEFALDIDAAELDLEVKADADEDEAIDLSAEFAENEAAAEDGQGEAAEETEIDISAELDETIITEAVEPADADAGSADNDPDATPEQAAADGSETPADDAMDLDLDDDDLGDLEGVDEVATKLDLARAYLDMGDSEGARSILDEAMAEGSDEQKKEAQELLDKLG